MLHRLPVAVVASLIVALSCKTAGTSKLRDDQPLQADQVRVTCPTSLAEWQKFLTTSSDQLTAPYLDDASGFGSQMLFAATTQVLAMLKQCASGVAALPNGGQCLTNLGTFANSQHLRNNVNTMGLTEDNAAYILSHEASDKPAGMMIFPAPLATGTQMTLTDVEATAKQQNWPYVIHESGLTHVQRLFIYILGPVFDQWIIYDVSDGEQLARYPSFIAVRKLDSSGQPLTPPKAYYRDIALTGAGNANATVPLVADGAKCYSCHPNGMRSLIPYPTQYTAAEPVQGDAQFGQPVQRADFGMLRVNQFINVIKNYGLVDFDGAYNPDDHGPPLGDAEGCTSCHNGQDRGVLTYSTQLEQIGEKVTTEKIMPPSLHQTQPSGGATAGASVPAQADQTAAEQAKALEIYQSFERNRPLTVKKWLLETACGDAGSMPKPAGT